jgi:hypothetical protein
MDLPMAQARRVDLPPLFYRTCVSVLCVCVCVCVCVKYLNTHRDTCSAVPAQKKDQDVLANYTTTMPKL